VVDDSVAAEVLEKTLAHQHQVRVAAATELVVRAVGRRQLLGHLTRERAVAVDDLDQFLARHQSKPGVISEAPHQSAHA
jgi:hypothetical protein